MSTRNATAYIGFGSNLGDRAGNLLLALKRVVDVGLSVSRISSIYETAPVGLKQQPHFLNMVVEVNTTTDASPEDMLEQLQRVELKMGRTREVFMGPRTIDLDLLFFNQEQRHTELLTIPHPRLHLRRFVLVPLAELAPQMLHPILEKTISKLLEELDDDSQVRLWCP